MAGLDLPAKLRRSVGRGQVVAAEVLIEQLSPYDRDGDGRLTKSELVRFLAEAGLGGPWFCDMFASTVWRKSHQAFEREVASLAVPLLARVLHFAMARTSSPSRRYVISPDAFRGHTPRVDAQNQPVDAPAADVGRRPAKGPRPPAPRGAAPKRGPGPARPAPAKGPAGSPRRGPVAKPSPRGPAPRGRPVGRSGPRRPSGRPRS